MNTSTDTPANILEPRAIIGGNTPGAATGLCGKNYFVPDYQRGYRWTPDHVRQLLEDITSFIKGTDNGRFYCLQPVVVKKLSPEKKAESDLPNPEEDWYEVIDGQQRLTTIRIILAVMKLFEGMMWPASQSFRLHYRTRPDLGGIFDRLAIRGIQEGNPEVFITDGQGNPVTGGLDIDSFHVLNAARAILSFFPLNGDSINLRFFRGSFSECFLNTGANGEKSVKVIWYELTDTDAESATRLFERLNEKCIKLNNAELVRALFLSQAAPYEIDNELTRLIDDRDLRLKIINRERGRKQAHIITQWDVMEQQLREPSLWAFINKDNDTESYDCRIEYIFDLVARKSIQERDSLHTLLEFERMARTGSDGLWELWRKVERYHSTLLSWSRDRDLYHKIGFIVLHRGRQALMELLEKSTAIPRSAPAGWSKQNDEDDEETPPSFNDLIDGMIREIVALPKDRSLEQLSYMEDKDRPFIHRLLTLFNVESTRLQESELFFPFDRFKDENKRSGSGWTLEHIHAQNSELIDQNDRDKWVEFIEENLRALRKMRTRYPDPSHPFSPEQIIKTLEHELPRARNIKTFSYNDLTTLYGIVSGYFDRFLCAEDRATNLHSISNMALLSQSVNSAAGKSAFEVKRQLIIDKDAEGEYIPICTRKVFLKYFNRNQNDFETAQQFYWGKEDQDNYYSEMLAILSPYI